jgi:hypothetical protein
VAVLRLRCVLWRTGLLVTARLERLDAVKTRLQAMVDAMSAIRPKLQSFYASLSDDQKARFNTMAPPQNASAARQDSNQCRVRDRLLAWA